MSLGKRTRRLLAIIFCVVVLVVLALLAIPLWLPWALPHFARTLGASYGRYERIGYSKFALHQVVYQESSTRVSAGRVEGATPLAWLWALAFERRDSSKPFVRIKDWQVTSLTNSAAPHPSPGLAKPRAGSQRIPRTLRTISRWIPTAELTNGRISLSPAVVLVAPSLNWSNASVSGLVSVWDSGPIEVSAQPSGTDAFSGSLISNARHLAAQLQAKLSDNAVAVRSSAFWWTNHIEAQVIFAPGHSLPVNASVTASNLDLPAQELGLPYYGNIAGSVAARWQTNSFVVDAELRGQPLPDSTNLPPVELSLHARGNTNAAIVETATLSSPWLRASLSHELELFFTGAWLREPAQVSFGADLGSLPWFKASGRVEGAARLGPGPTNFPTARFSVTGSELSYASFQAKTISTEGEFTWPRLQISNLTAVLNDGSKLVLRGEADLQTKSTRAGQVRAAGPVFKRWLPPEYQYGSLGLTAEFSGPLNSLRHEGVLNVTNLTTPGFQPLDLNARWHGVQTNLERFEIEAETSSASLTAAGSLQMRGAAMEIGLSALAILTNKQPGFVLRQPAQIQLLFGRPMRLGISSFDLEGAAGRISLAGSVAWPQAGTFNLQVEQIGTNVLCSFLKRPVPDLQILHLAATGNWSNGPLALAVNLKAGARSAGARGKALKLGLDLEASGNASGLLLSNLVITSQTSAVVKARGSLPVLFVPSRGDAPFQLLTNQELNFTASTGADAFFWQELAKVIHLELRQPRAHIQVSGTWDEPVGSVNIRAEELKFPQSRTNLPALQKLELELELDRKQARLTSGQILVQGQRVALIAEFPLGAAFWNQLGHKKLPDWRAAAGHLQIQEAELAAFAPLFPTLLAPQGEISADLVLQRGGTFAGEVSIAHARTRPLGNTGPLRDIAVHIVLHDREVELRSAHANLGGATITLNGQLDLSGDEWLESGMPPFAVSLHGLNVPLARQPEYVVRSDLLLGIVRTNGAPPLITGRAKLHDSFYLSDLRALIPGKVAGPALRPPYFSIDEPTVADWRLAVDVQGTRFMKLRSPLFNGEISSNVKLQGTLKDPIVLGDVKIESGLVRFPFASLQVQQGLVNLTSQDPYHPQLSVRAASKQFGYDIRMEVSGPVDAPVIQFNSTPPLSSEQILLMVSAGELPQGTFSLSPQQRAQTVALFLGRDVLSKLGIGDQGEQRLSIRSGEEISEQGRPTYRVEYKLTDRWSLTGEYDRFGDFNAGVKWRVYSK